MVKKKKCPKCGKEVRLSDDGKNFSWHTDRLGFTCDNSWKPAK